MLLMVVNLSLNLRYRTDNLVILIWKYYLVNCIFDQSSEKDYN